MSAILQPPLPDVGPVRFSHLKAYGRSGAHGYQARFSPEAQVTYAMQRGTAVHALLFDTRRVVGYPGSVRRGKDYDAFTADNPDSEILTMSEFVTAQRMAESVRNCKLAKPWLEGIVEKTILFRWQGIDCRSTPDVRGPDFVTELKTCADASPFRFPWHARKMCYHAQLRMESIAAGNVEHHHIVAVESKPPYPVTVFTVTPRALEVGEKMLVLWAEALKACEASREWPAYSQTVCEFDVTEDEPELIFPEEE
jgi:hypothetical protein